MSSSALPGRFRRTVSQLSLQQLSRDSNVKLNCNSWGVCMTIKKSTAPLGLEPASVFSSASEDECFQNFGRLRRDKRLSAAVRQLNVLLSDKGSGKIAERALSRVGLWHAG